jgi:hypothetical protein
MFASRWSFVAATLLGLVAMHGLGSHGVHGVEPVDAVVSMHHMAAADLEHQASGVDAASETGQDAGTLALGSGCLAVLIGLGFAIRAIARSSTPVSRQRGCALAYSFASGHSQNRSPPTLAELSILRC